MNFKPTTSLNSMLLDVYVDKTDYMQQREYEQLYCDELTDAYRKLKEMYSFNYDSLIDSDYDEMMKIHYYEWLHTYSCFDDDSVS
jgi:hypothetical protein